MTPEFEFNYACALGVSSRILSGIMQTIMTTECDTEEAWTCLMENDVYVPINIVLWRTWITHEMSSGIMMKAGTETGANLYGHANMEMSSENVTKTLYGNYTFTAKAIVWKKENVIILEDLFPRGYVGGHNTTYATEAKDILFANQYSEHGSTLPSVIATVVPGGERPNAQIMSLTGKINPNGLEHKEQERHYHYSTAELYCLVYELEKLVSMTELDVNDDFYKRTMRMNFTAFEGTSFHWNHHDGVYSAPVNSQSHLGHTFPGCADSWGGSKGILPKFVPSDWSRILV